MNINTFDYYITEYGTELFWCMVVFVLLLLIFLWFNTIAPFLRERDYIRMEINRSFDKDRHRFWKSELKRLHLRYIPFLGRFFR